MPNKYFFTLILLLVMTAQIARAQNSQPVKTKSTAGDMKDKTDLTDAQKRKLDMILKWCKVKSDSLKKAAKGNQRELADMETIEHAYLANQIKSSLTEKQRQKFVDMHGAKSASSDLNQSQKIFPFPPPKDYTSYTLSGNVFKSSKNLQDVHQELLKALTSCGYADLSYYSVPGGFAIVTKAEEINSDGSSFPSPGRFKLNYPDHMRAAGTISADVGRFRVFAFVLTNVPFGVVDDTGKTPIAGNWIGDGIEILPPALAEIKLTPEYHCSVLVYEFQAGGHNAPLIPVKTTKLSAEEHLQGSKLNQYLGL